MMAAATLENDHNANGSLTQPLDNDRNEQDNRASR